MNEKLSLQKDTLIYLIVNIIFTFSAFIILNLTGLGMHWIPILYYCGVKLTYLNILLGLGFSVGYIINFYRKNTRMRFFLLSILCVMASVFLNVYLIIKVEAGGYLVQ